MKVPCHLCGTEVEQSEHSNHQKDPAFAREHVKGRIIRDASRDFDLTPMTVVGWESGVPVGDALEEAWKVLSGGFVADIERRWMAHRTAEDAIISWKPDFTGVSGQLARLFDWIRKDPEQGSDEYVTQFGLQGDGYKRPLNQAFVGAMLYDDRLMLSFHQGEPRSRHRIDGSPKSLVPWSQAEIDGLFKTIESHGVKIDLTWGAVDTEKSNEPLFPDADFLSLVTNLKIGPNVHGLFARYHNGGSVRPRHAPEGWR